MPSTTSQGSPIVLLVMFVIWLAVYIFFAYCLKRIVEKCGVKPGALIWIPILQLIPLFQAGKMNPWLILVLFVPLANLVVIIMLWVNILKTLGQHPAMVILFFLPLVNLIYFLYLAFSGPKAATATA